MIKAVHHVYLIILSLAYNVNWVSPGQDINVLLVILLVQLVYLMTQLVVYLAILMVSIMKKVEIAAIALRKAIVLLACKMLLRTVQVVLLGIQWILLEIIVQLDALKIV